MMRTSTRGRLAAGFLSAAARPMETQYKPGEHVRIAAGWRDRPEEATAVYRVVEDNTDRCVIELICDLPIRPRELVRKYMIERA